MPEKFVCIVTRYTAHWESWDIIGVYTSEQDARRHATDVYDDDDAERYGVVVEWVPLNTPSPRIRHVLHLNIDRDD